MASTISGWEQERVKEVLTGQAEPSVCYSEESELCVY